MTRRNRHILVLILCIALGLQGGIIAQNDIGPADTLLAVVDNGQIRDSVNFGYGFADSYTLGSSIGSLDFSNSISRISPLENLQGRIAGTQVVVSSGMPGGEASFLVRGVRSLAAGSQPLYVVDGFPLYSDNFGASSQVATGPATDIMSMFNPEDIASVTVLKDAGAKAIYGARGSNGVILIETKRGIANRPSIDLSVSGGIQQVIDKYDMLDGATFARYINESLVNAGESPMYSDPEAFGNGTNWQDEVTSTAAIQDYHLRFSGGSSNTQYMLSGSFTGSDGIYRNNELQRYTLHGNIKSRARANLVITNSLNFSRTDIATSSSDVTSLTESPGLTGSALMFSPLLGVNDSDGNLTVLNSRVNDSGVPGDELQTEFPLVSPVAQSDYVQSEVNNTRFTNYLSIDWTIIDDLTLRIAGGVDAIFNEEAIFGSSALNPDATLGGYGSAAKLQNINWVNEYQLKYSKSLRESDRLEALAGFSIQGFDSELLQGESQGFENESLGFYNLGVGQNKSINSYLDQWSLVSFYARVHYSLNDRFHFDVTGRADGSSRFNGDYAFYPSFSFGWNIIHPALDMTEGAINGLTLRASTGCSGNSEISPYATLATLRQFETDLNGVRVAGFRPVSLANGDLEVERTREFNLGISLDLLENRFAIDIDFYQQITNNALVFLPQAGTAGIDFALANGAETSGSGIELGLNGAITNGTLDWRVGLNLAYLSSEVKAVDGNIEFATGSPIRGVDQWSIVGAGARIGSFYGYETNGIVQAGDNISDIPAFAGEILNPGDRKYKDNNGDGLIDENDKTILGEALPDVVIGLDNTLKFGGLDLNIYFEGAFGQQVANFNKLDIETLNGQSNITQEAYDDRWTPDNPGNTYPSAVAAFNERIFSDAIVEDGSYFRLRSMTLGYTFGGDWMDRGAMDKLRIYAQAVNLLTFTSYSGIDPDVSHFGQSAIEGGVDLDSYPKSRQFLFGIQLSF